MLDYDNKRETESVWNNAVWDEIKFKSSIANIVKMTKACTIKKHKTGSSQQKQSESKKKTQRICMLFQKIKYW